MEYNRINNCLLPKNLTIFNSYKLNKTELIINIEQINNNNTKCLYNIYLTQIKATNIGDYNISEFNEEKCLSFPYQFNNDINYPP